MFLKHFDLLFQQLNKETHSKQTNVKLKLRIWPMSFFVTTVPKDYWLRTDVRLFLLLALNLTFLCTKTTKAASTEGQKRY